MIPEVCMRFDDADLNNTRFLADQEADDLIANVAASGRMRECYPYLSLSRFEVQFNESLPEVRQFLLQGPLLPKWFDADRLKKGQKFFHRHALDIMTLLGAMSLPYCYAATPGNKAIYLTGKMRKSPGMRLLDTAHFIIEVLKEGSFDPEGSGSFEVQRTRLVHALVRNMISRGTDWDPAWGIPINQEDMAGTNLAFSYVILIGMDQSGFDLRDEEKEDFLYAWRFIGYQLRIDEWLLPGNLGEARELEQAIRSRHFRKSPEGSLLTSELIDHYRRSFPAVAAYFVDSQIRHFVGPEISELLGLQPQTTKDKIVNIINVIRKSINRTVVNPFSYQLMMRNHLKLKRKYSATE
jgi:hypothetical protein